MEKQELLSVISGLKEATNPGSITPLMLGNVLENMVAFSEENSATGFPQISCYVKKKTLYVRNANYYLQQGYVPILFRYIKKRNRVKFQGNKSHSDVRKGWFQCGRPGTIRISESGMVERSISIINVDGPNSSTVYSSEAEVFPTNQHYDVPCVRWGCTRIDVGDQSDGNYRMIRLPFAIGFWKRDNRKLQSRPILATEMVSNLAPFFVRGQKEAGSNYIWNFSR